MNWFTPAFGKFFAGLRKNNNKEWFDENKPLYEQNVKAPFEAFVGALIKESAKLNPAIRITPKDAIFRIYKDVRFSKDKTPYKDYVSALIGPSGRKDMESPAWYISLNDKEIMIAGGAYMPEKEYLHRIRLAIANDLKGFRKIITAKDFVKCFGTVQGEKNKRLLPEIAADAEKEPLLFNKQFYFQANLKPALLTSDKLVKEIVECFKASQPFNEFMLRAKNGK